MVWIPNWEINALVVDIPPGAHGAIEERGFLKTVTPSAWKCGVRQGMRVSMARYLCPDLLILQSDPRRELNSFEVIVQACEQWVAGIACVRPGLAWAPASGAARWSGSEEQLAENIVDSISRWSGSESNVGIASGPLASYAAARRGIIVPPERTQEFLDHIDLAQCLPLFPQKQHEQLQQVIDTCRSVGVMHGRDLMRMGESALYTRFGNIGQQLYELFSGKDLWIPKHEIPVREVQVDEECEESIENEEQAAFCSRRLARQICEKLEREQLRCSSIVITARDQSHETYERQWWGIDGDEEEIADRIRWQLVAWLSASTTEEGLNRISVQALHCMPSAGVSALWKTHHSPKRDSALRKICAYKGEDAVRLPCLVPGYTPMQRSGFACIDQTVTSSGDLLCPEGAVEDAPSKVYATPLPAFLYAHSSLQEHVQVAVSDRSTLTHNPKEIVAVISGRQHRYGVLSWKGPWSMPHSWWQETAEAIAHAPCTHYLRVSCENSSDLLLMWEQGSWSVAGMYEDHQG